MEKCEKCGMPLEGEGGCKCSCNQKLCCHCCECPEECPCGCKEKAEKTKEK